MNKNHNQKPRIWLAIIFGLFTSIFSMLYVARPKYFFGYFLLSIAFLIIDILLQSVFGLSWAIAHISVYLIIPICTIHAAFLARSYDKTKRPYYSRWYGTLACIAICVTLIVLVRAFLFEPFRIPSIDMEPTYKPGTMVLVSKIGFDNHSTFSTDTHKKENPKYDLKRGDIIVFEYPPKPQIRYIKRIVGIPGDDISYKNNQLFINGKLIDTEAVSESENYSEQLPKHPHLIHIKPDFQLPNANWQVPTGHYFVLGDNRTHSSDSRQWGFVSSSAVIGRVIGSINGYSF